MRSSIISLFVCFFSVFSLFAEEINLDLLPKADEQGIVLSSRVLSIKGAQFPFNASLILNQKKDGYWLFFRENFMGLTSDSFGGARIGVVPLNKNFIQTKDPLFPPYPIFGKSVEDPRAFWIEDSLYVLYYIYPRPAPSTPCLVKLNPSNLAPLSISLLSHDMIPEKNWVPLIPKTNESTLRFLRNLFPLDLVEVNLQEKTTHFSPNATTLLRAEPKNWKWGSLSGGTQAELIGDRYFSFFHSWYLAESGKRIYVLGACTFNTSPPFTMKEISPYPILFKELYTAKACGIVGNPYGLKWAQNLEKVIFPCGFVETTLASGRKVFHLSCGENDNSIRIITFDKEALLKSLIPVQN